jgi:hypothetical protein
MQSSKRLKKEIEFLHANPEHYKKLFYNLQEKYIKDYYYTGEHINNRGVSGVSGRTRLLPGTLTRASSAPQHLAYWP